MEKLTKENYFNEFSKAWLELSKKGKFSYASWSDVWDFLKKNVTDAKYEWCENKEWGLWFVDDYGCFAKVRVWSDSLNVEVTQHLHAMSVSNQAVQRESLTASDINKTYQRCLVKAVATGFGLGLYIYKGEDLPAESDWVKPVKKEHKKDDKKKAWISSDENCPSCWIKCENIRKWTTKTGKPYEMGNCNCWENFFINRQ